ncbi:MAG: hypothetical protein QNJ51_27295 [Calothrix sp. MO_167.B12]|nr:hypothetical protein [Calothrix sp. MO_167.B12]
MGEWGSGGVGEGRSDELKTVKHQPPTINHQLTTTNHQPPTNNQQPTTNNHHHLITPSCANILNKKKGKG